MEFLGTDRNVGRWGLLEELGLEGMPLEDRPYPLSLPLFSFSASRLSWAMLYHDRPTEMEQEDPGLKPLKPGSL